MSNSVNEILIIGLGLIGASIAKASKEKGIIVHGYDIKKSVIETAFEDNVIDQSIDSIEGLNNKSLIDKIDLVIISVSPKATQEIINQIPNLMNTKITITDTSSVKNHLKISSISNFLSTPSRVMKEVSFFGDLIFIMFPFISSKSNA